MKGSKFNFGLTSHVAAHTSENRQIRIAKLPHRIPRPPRYPRFAKSARIKCQAANLKKSLVIRFESKEANCDRIVINPKTKGVQTSTKTSGANENRASLQAFLFTSLRKSPFSTERLALVDGSKKHHRSSVRTPENILMQQVMVPRISGPSQLLPISFIADTHKKFKNNAKRD